MFYKAEIKQKIGYLFILLLLDMMIKEWVEIVTISKYGEHLQVHIQTEITTMLITNKAL